MTTLKHLLELGPIYLALAGFLLFMSILGLVVGQTREGVTNFKWRGSRAVRTMLILFGLSFLSLLPSARYSIWEQYVGRDGKQVVYQLTNGGEVAGKMEIFHRLHPDRAILSVNYRPYDHQLGGELIIRHGSRTMRSDDQMLGYVFAFKHPSKSPQ